MKFCRSHTVYKYASTPLHHTARSAPRWIIPPDRQCQVSSEYRRGWSYVPPHWPGTRPRLLFHRRRSSTADAWHRLYTRYKVRSTASRSTVVRTTRARRCCPQWGPSTLRHSVRALSCHRPLASPAEQGLGITATPVVRHRNRPSSRATRSGRRFLS